jgi:hypothetical protein
MLSIQLQSDKKVYKSFANGRLLPEMEIDGAYIIGRLYMDCFGVNCPIGSSRSKDKLLGVYYSVFSDLTIASKRSTIQTVALLNNKDIENFGLSKCLEPVMNELKELVIHGYYDKKTNTA